MRKAFKNTALALGISGAMALGGTTPLSAAPVPSAMLALAAAAPDHTTNVYWRGRWGWGPAIGLGIAGAVLAGAALAAGPYGYGGYPVYGGGYYPAYGGYYPPPNAVYGVPYGGYYGY